MYFFQMKLWQIVKAYLNKLYGFLSCKRFLRGVFMKLLYTRMPGGGMERGSCILLTIVLLSLLSMALSY